MKDFIIKFCVCMHEFTDLYFNVCIFVYVYVYFKALLFIKIVHS